MRFDQILRTLFLLISTRLNLNNVSAYKIVIFATGHSNSQILFHYRLADVVASHGHDVTVFIAHYNRKAKAELPKLAKVIMFEAITDHDHFAETDARFQGQIYGVSFSWIDYIQSFVDYTNNVFVKGCENHLKNGPMLKKLADEKFDLAISHNYDFCPIGIIHALKIPTFIWMAAGTFTDTMAWTLGLPNPPSFVPSSFSAYSDRMSFVERFKNFLGMAFYHQMHWHYMVEPQNRLFRQYFGADFPSVERLAAKAPLVFVNSDEMLDFPRPTFHKIVYMAGAVNAAAPKAQPLASKWDALTRKSSRGFFLVSFGGVANASMMPQAWKDSFLRAFAQFPEFTFIWKYETKCNATDLSSNVVTTEWMPMRDLMGHPNARGIISHGGMNSFLEAANIGIPMIMIPLFNDQSGNMKKAERLGVGIGIQRSSLAAGNGHALIEAIGQISNNNSYKANAKLLAEKLAKRAVKPESLVVGWIEYLAEFKDLSNLQPTSADQNLIHHFSLDILACLCLMLYFILRFLYWIIRTMITKLLNKRRICENIEVEDRKTK